jgi:hypothetical protein
MVVVRLGPAGDPHLSGLFPCICAAYWSWSPIDVLGAHVSVVLRGAALLIFTCVYWATGTCRRYWASNQASKEDLFQMRTFPHLKDAANSAGSVLSRV